MTKKLCISSHNLKSKALKALQQELSSRVGYYVYRVKPDRVRNRVSVHFDKGLDKITQYEKFNSQAVPCPAFATDFSSARDLPSELVLVRALTKGSEGRGISVVEKSLLNEEEHKAPLYTEYIKKKKEFRVHVYNNKVIDVQEKRKRVGFEGERNTKIRNTANGYVFCRDNLNPPDDLFSCAIRAVQSLGRSQGAVDVIYNERQNKCFALEVNARPGLQGQTLVNWSKAILENPEIRKST